MPTKKSYSPEEVLGNSSNNVTAPTSNKKSYSPEEVLGTSNNTDTPVADQPSTYTKLTSPPTMSDFNRPNSLFKVPNWTKQPLGALGAAGSVGLGVPGGIFNSIAHPVNSFLNPLQDLYNQAKEENQNGLTLPGIVHSAESAVPILGPMVNGLTNQVQKGDIGPAIGSGLTQAGLAATGDEAGDIAGGVAKPILKTGIRGMGKVAASPYTPIGAGLLGHALGVPLGWDIGGAAVGSMLARIPEFKNLAGRAATLGEVPEWQNMMAQPALVKMMMKGTNEDGTLAPNNEDFNGPLMNEVTRPRIFDPNVSTPDQYGAMLSDREAALSKIRGSLDRAVNPYFNKDIKGAPLTGVKTGIDPATGGWTVTDEGVGNPKFYADNAKAIAKARAKVLTNGFAPALDMSKFNSLASKVETGSGYGLAAAQPFGALNQNNGRRDEFGNLVQDENQ